MSKFSKKIVILVVSLNFIFAFSVLYVILKGAVEPKTLIVSWFGFTGGELWLLAGIKKAKVKQLGKEKDDGGNKDEIV